LILNKKKIKNYSDFFILQIIMTGTDSVVKGEISRKSHHVKSEGSKVHRGMSKIFYQKNNSIL